MNTFEKPVKKSQQKFSVEILNCPEKKIRIWPLLFEPALHFHKNLFCRRLWDCSLCLPYRI